MQEKFKKATRKAVAETSVGEVMEALEYMRDNKGKCKAPKCKACPGDHLESLCDSCGWVTLGRDCETDDPLCEQNASDALEYMESLEC